MSEDQSRTAQAEQLAKDILSLSVSSLIVNFRFLDRAISRLELRRSDKVSLAADGECIYYEPWYILSLYRSQPSAVTRSLLHCIFHCVFRHNFVGRDIDRLRWDLAADIAVENAINGLNAPAVAVGSVDAQMGTVAVLTGELPSLSAERIYKWLGDKLIPRDELESEREPFWRDNHGIWYGMYDENAEFDEKINIKKIWEDVSRRMETELETVNRDNSGALVQNLRSLNRAKYDYTDFLRRFGVHGEVMRLSDREFDNNYYSYGLELYGNIPLVEPLEYSQQKRIREFVIAIDTSGSVNGDVVQAFIQHTHDILSRQDSFFSRMELHIIQCDNCVREDVLIRTAEEFQAYLGSLEIRGLGETDFRPVFRHIDGLRSQGKLRHLQGLLYFTDGLGIFPGKKPDYDTAFIIHSDGYNDPDVPSWAIRLTLQEDDILDGRFSAY